ncbi:MAG: redoxin domain-containing protein [Ferrimicrobium acidiphilum]
MTWAILSYAFVVGMASTVNPCGAAMLPAYLTWSTRSRDSSASSSVRLFRAILVGLITTGGFVVVFAVAGVLVSAGMATFMNVVPEIGATIGVVLIVIGILTLSGRHVGLRLPGTSRPLGGGKDNLRAMGGFGISYALASLGCTLPVFLAGVAGAFTRHGIGEGIGAFFAYALGMGSVLTALAVAVALIPNFKLKTLRRISASLERPAGALLALVGVYIVYYWVSDLRGAQSSSALIVTVDGVAGTVAGAIASIGPLLGVLLVGAIALTLVVLVIGRRRALAKVGATDTTSQHMFGSYGESSTWAPTVLGERPTQRPRRRVPRWLSAAAVTLGLMLISTEVLVVTGVIADSPSSSSTLTSLSPAVTKSLRLSVFTAKTTYLAPNFSLRDQFGHTVNLLSFRGKAVILTFMSNQCQSACSNYIEDVQEAVADLGSLSPRVAFVTINTNSQFPLVVSNIAFDSVHGISNLTSWHYLTGSPASLRSTLSAYGVRTIARQSNPVVGNSKLEFIDPSGRVRAYGSYRTLPNNVALAGYGLATVAENLLGVNTKLSAHALTSPPASTSTLAPSFTLANVGAAGGRTVSLQKLRGHFVVLNFFASWCSACQSEALGFASVARHLPGNVKLVGIDINDSTSAVHTFIDHYHLPYAIGFDGQGSVAAKYGVSALPTTVFISPKGRVLMRHVGSITSSALSRQLAQLHGKS